MKTARALFCTTSALAIVLLGAAPAVAAAPEEHGVDHYDVTFTAVNLCGSGHSPAGHAVGTMTEQVRTTESGAPLFFSNFVGTTTFTEGDRSVVVRYGGPTRDVSLVDNGDGTITLTGSTNGLISSMTDAAGNTIYRETGRMVAEFVLDLNGTPSDPEDDILLSVTPLASSGHQGSEEQFCDALLTALYS